MTVFAILATDPAKAKPVVEAAFADKIMSFGAGRWVVSADGLTAQQVTEKVGANGEIGSVVVFSIGSYWGYYNKNLWEWLESNIR